MWLTLQIAFRVRHLCLADFMALVWGLMGCWGAMGLRVVGWAFWLGSYLDLVQIACPFPFWCSSSPRGRRGSVMDGCCSRWRCQPFCQRDSVISDVLSLDPRFIFSQLSLRWSHTRVLGLALILLVGEDQRVQPEISVPCQGDVLSYPVP